MRRRTEPSGGTGGKWATTTSEPGGISSAVSPGCRPAASRSSPFTVSTRSVSPVSRTRADGFEAVLPVRTTFR